MTYGGQLKAARCISKISVASEESAGRRMSCEFLSEPIVLCSQLGELQKFVSKDNNVGEIHSNKFFFGRPSRSEVSQKWRSYLRTGICKNGEAVPNPSPASCKLHWRVGLKATHRRRPVGWSVEVQEAEW